MTNLEKKQILFIQDKNEFQVLSFRKDKMTVELKNTKTQETSSLVFAHLPKKIKAILNPK